MVDPNRRREPSFESGHDAPVTLREQDSYGRWPVATAISRVVDASPMEWSTRIGLFGRWGDGKTSVLNFLETQQKERHNIVIRYSPWGVSNESSMWRGFCDALVKGFRANGIPVSFWRRAEYWLRARLDPLATTAKFAGRLVQASGQAPFGRVVGEALASALPKAILSKRDVDRVRGCASGQRVVVFIDDLDRADPVVIPQLLLALRELLDLPRFTFVLAFDRSIVAAALEKYNPAWGKSGFQFLEKVVDFPFTLPSPSPEQVMSLANTQFLENCPFVPSATLDEVAKYLPHNPRRLKLFARLITGMREEAERHDEIELDWSLILLLSLLSTKNNELANEFVAQITDSETEFSWLHFFDDEARQEKMKESLKQMVERHSVDLEQNERMMVLCQALIDQCRNKASEDVRYHARFALSPDCITWREFRAFFHHWKASKTSETIRQFVEERSIALRNPVDIIEVELVGTVISHHSDLLEKASNVTAQEAHLQLMADALENLDLLRQCLVPPTIHALYIKSKCSTFGEGCCHCSRSGGTSRPTKESPSLGTRRPRRCWRSLRQSMIRSSYMNDSSHGATENTTATSAPPSSTKRSCPKSVITWRLKPSKPLWPLLPSREVLIGLEHRMDMRLLDTSSLRQRVLASPTPR